MEERSIYSLWLASRKGISNPCKKDLILKYGSAKKLYFMNSDEINELWIDDNVKTALKGKNLDEAKYIAEKCESKGIDVIAFEDDFYPPLLKEISNPPYLLYKKGKDIDYRNIPMASVVGSRILSEYGKFVTEKLSDELCRAGFLIVSGMALGADGAAHCAAINAGAATVAVLGCGVDVIYPHQNREIYEYISRYGAVLSEYPPETPPTRSTFPARNRIISGMSHLTVVTESRLKSGSLITAGDAHAQGKEVFAVPQNINSPYGQGSNQLLKDYARVITSGADALDYYIKAFKSGDYTKELREAVALRKEKKEKSIFSEKMYDNIPLNLNEEEKKIINVLKNGITHINKIAAETGYPTGKVTAVASLLEIRGLIYSVTGNAYGLTDPQVWNSGESRI